MTGSIAGSIAGSMTGWTPGSVGRSTTGTDGRRNVPGTGSRISLLLELSDYNFHSPGNGRDDTEEGTGVATIEDVAARAGVGIGTVSRVLNDSPQVRPVTRARVLEAMQELDYSPSRAAKTSRSRAHQSIAVLVPFFDQPAAYQRLRGIVGQLQPHGFEIVLMNVESTSQARERLLELPRRRDIDGLIVISLPLGDKEGERLASAKFRTVLVDTQHDALPSIVIDDRYGGEMATNHLIDLRHERIAFIGEPRQNPFGFYSSGHREDGYLQAMSRASLDVLPGYVKYGPHLRSAARAMAIELFALATPPTAIVAVSDVMALGVLEAAHATGHHVPEDFSLIGYDDIEFSAYVGLTTVRQPLFLSGVRGAEVLLSALAAEDSRPFTEQLSLELIARTTTAPLSRPDEVARRRISRLDYQ
jgi:DNA-binding LacI/PurR family transcriptional regulator